MKAFTILLFNLFLFSNIEGSYSINALLDYLQQSRYYEIIQAVKINFGDDVAISVCIELVHSNHCDEIVRVYMTNSYVVYSLKLAKASNQTPQKLEENPKLEELVPEPKEIVKPLLNCILKYYDVLKKNMKEEDIQNFLNNINSSKLIIRKLPEPIEFPSREA